MKVEKQYQYILELIDALVWSTSKYHRDFISVCVCPHTYISEMYVIHGYTTTYDVRRVYGSLVSKATRFCITLTLKPTAASKLA